TTEAAPVLQRLHDEFAALENWQAEPLHDIVAKITAELSVGMGKVAQPLRVAVCGCGVSPAIQGTLVVLGKAKTLARLQQAIKFITNTGLVA
ncbi:MAG: hypothetical protein RL637_1779, partial [Pseudomonadota bacterium]